MFKRDTLPPETIIRPVFLPPIIILLVYMLHPKISGSTRAPNMMGEAEPDLGHARMS